MSAFGRAFELLIGHEGGYVNHPSDPGGETKFGISKRSHPDLDIAALTLADAKAIYKRDYWDRVRGDALPPALAFLVFDAAVNNGVGRAIRWLQAAARVTVDGKIGPATLVAAEAPVVAERFHMLRVEFMTDLDGWKHFGRGWARRLAALPFQALGI